MSKAHLLLALLAPTIALAQPSGQSEVPPPPPTFLPLKTPAIFAWERLAYPLALAGQLEAQDSKAPTPGAMRKEGRKVGDRVEPLALAVQGTRDRGSSREVFRWSDGRISERWLLANFILDQQADGTVAVIDPRLHPTVVAARSATPFSELSWLRPTYYRGMRTLQGRPCYFYQGKPVAEINPESTEVTSDYSAWIDAQTGFPLASTDSDSLWVYKQIEAKLPAPSPLFQSAREEAEKRYQRVVGKYKPVKI